MVKKRKEAHVDDIKEEISEEIIDEDKKLNVDDEPSWYHYVIVLLVFILVFFGVYYLFIANPDSIALNETSSGNVTILDENGTAINVSLNELDVFSNSYSFESTLEDGSNINLGLNFPISELNSFEIPLELSKFDLLNSDSISFSYMTYEDPIDNFIVTKSSIKFMRFLMHVYDVKFLKDSFSNTKIMNCSTSSVENKVFIFNPYLETSGIFYNETSGCIIVGSDSANGILKVLDKYMYNLTLIS